MITFPLLNIKSILDEKRIRRCEMKNTTTASSNNQCQFDGKEATRTPVIQLTPSCLTWCIGNINRCPVSLVTIVGVSRNHILSGTCFTYVMLIISDTYKIENCANYYNNMKMFYNSKKLEKNCFCFGTTPPYFVNLSSFFLLL